MVQRWDGGYEDGSDQPCEIAGMLVWWMRQGFCWEQKRGELGARKKHVLADRSSSGKREGMRTWTETGMMEAGEDRKGELESIGASDEGKEGRKEGTQGTRCLDGEASEAITE